MFLIITILSVLMAGLDNPSSVNLYQTCQTPIEFEENHSWNEQKVLSMHIVSGRALDAGKVGVPVCLGVFTEKGHRLIAETTADENGYFEFKHIPVGHYRLVAKYSYLCPASISIRVLKRPKGKLKKNRQIAIHMGLYSHECSFGDYLH
jgi:hypothetical protein